MPIDKDLPREMIDRSGPIPGLDVGEDMDVDDKDPMEENEILGPEEDLTGVPVEEDSAALELEATLNKALKLKQKKKPLPDVQSIASKIVSEAGVKMEGQSDDDQEGTYSSGSHGMNIMLNATSEFCRTLGEIPTYGQAGNREEEEDELMVRSLGLQCGWG